MGQCTLEQFTRVFFYVIFSILLYFFFLRVLSKIWYAPQYMCAFLCVLLFTIISSFHTNAHSTRIWEAERNNTDTRFRRIANIKEMQNEN